MSREMGRDEYVAHSRRRGRGHQTHDEWFDVLVPGDILDWNGRPRKVRAVKRYDDDCVYMIEMLKVARSGYRSPTTIRYRSEIRQNARGIIGHASLCTTELECAVQREIDDDGGWRHHKYTENDTVGIIT
jgi:hypothetical protein